MSPYLIGGALIVFLLGVGGAYFYGRSDGRDLCQAEHSLAALAQAADTLRRERDAANAIADAERRTADALAQVRVETRTIIQKVPVHVTPETDRRYPLPLGFERLHDAAALRVAVSAIPLPTGKSDGDPSAVTASQAASVIAGNYGEYHACREQVRGWKDAWEQAVLILRAPTP